VTTSLLEAAENGDPTSAARALLPECPLLGRSELPWFP
jgi:hypothetical protein